MALKKKTTRRKKSYKKIKRRRYAKKKKFSKSKRKRVFRKKRFARKSLTSSVFRQEFGGTARSGATAAGQMVYLGHALTGNDLGNTLFVSLLRKLLAEMGLYYPSEEDYVLRTDDGTGTPYLATGPSTLFLPSFAIIWRSNPADTTSRETYFDVGTTASTNVTLRQVAVSLYSQLLTDIRTNLTSNSYGPPMLIELRLYEKRPGTSGTGVGARDKIAAQIPLDKATVSVKFFSKLKIQNKTSSEGGTISTPATNTEVTNANPLAAKLYKGKYMKNHFDFKGQGKAALTSPLFVPINDSSNNVGGLIYSTDAKFARTNYREMPTRRDLDYKKEVSFVLHPGQIVQDKIFFKNKIGLNKLMWIMIQAFSVGTQEAVHYGLAHMIAFDKLVYDRSTVIYANDTTGTPISLGYEIDSSYEVDTKFKRTRAVPYVQINNTAYNPT